MKKIIVCLILALVLATSLCGCGSNRIDNGTASNSQTVAPSTNPYTTPAVDDGIVDDRDGILEDDNANGSMTGSTSGTTGNTGNGTGSTSGTSGSTNSGTGSTSGASGSANGGTGSTSGTSGAGSNTSTAAGSSSSANQ